MINQLLFYNIIFKYKIYYLVNKFKTFDYLFLFKYKICYLINKFQIFNYIFFIIIFEEMF